MANIKDVQDLIILRRVAICFTLAGLLALVLLIAGVNFNFTFPLTLFPLTAAAAIWIVLLMAKLGVFDEGF